jgi:hypothetical protein
LERDLQFATIKVTLEIQQMHFHPQPWIWIL